MNVASTNVTSTTISLTWAPPEMPNGVIANYSIAYTPDERIAATLEQLGIEATSATLSGLMEYVNYTIVLYAFTDKGRGEPSQSLLVETLQDRECNTG